MFVPQSPYPFVDGRRTPVKPGGGYRGGRNTTDYYRALDVRWLHRKRFLDGPTSTGISWSRGGEVVASTRCFHCYWSGLSAIRKLGAGSQLA